MKKIYSYLKHHLQDDFNFEYYLLIFLFLTISITINYHFNFFRDIVSSHTGFTKLFAYFLFYAFAYFFATLFYLITNNKKQVLTKKEFWIKSILFIFIVALDHSLPFLSPWIYEVFNPEIQLWAYKVLNNSVSMFTVLMPLLLFYYFIERKEKHVYGLQPKQFDVHPYFIMLLCMIPLIIAASFNSSFQNQYPMYKVSEAHIYLGVPEWLTVAIYELAYGFDFITVEFLFRGFLVIGMMSLLGRGSVLAMAVVYCFLHFGKPPGEAISSISEGIYLAQSPMKPKAFGVEL